MPTKILSPATPFGVALHPHTLIPSDHIEPGMVLAVRHFEPDARTGGHFGEDMVLVTAGAPEPLTTLGAGPLASGA